MSISLTDAKSHVIKNVQDFYELLINHLYPELFDSLNNIREMVDMLNGEMDISLKQAILNSLYQSLEEQVSKEKLVVLPYIIKLDADQKKLQNSSLIKNYNVLHKNLFTSIEALKHAIKNLISDDKWQLHVEHILFAISQWEEKLNVVQQFRNNYLTLNFL